MRWTNIEISILKEHHGSEVLYVLLKDRTRDVINHKARRIGLHLINGPQNNLYVRICRRCKLSLSLFRFYSNYKGSLGKSTICKDCDNIRRLQHKKTVSGRTSKRAYEKRKLSNDIQYRLACRLRRRLSQALKGIYKSGSAVHDLGCSIEKFKVYLESLFQSGMSWDNYGEWHIDHIIPLSKFDLTDREQLLKACHYTNLQPLWAEDNLRKGGV